MSKKGEYCAPLGDDGNPILRSATKPNVKDISKLASMQSVCNLMEGHETDDNLEGWIYCDPLLRFIRTVGPGNAAKLRSLYFGGWSIKYDLQFYGPFIKKYCPEIQKLTIGLVWLYSYHSPRSEMEQDLFKILRSWLAMLPSLKELVLIDEEEQLAPGVDELIKEMRMQQEANADTS